MHKRALALVMNCPNAPVAPITRILLFPIVFCLVWWEDQNQKSQDTEKQHSIWGWELKTKTNFEVVCASLSIFALNKNKEKNDKQPSQSLINDSPLRLFPLLKADKPNAICKQNYMWKRAPKMKCFLHSDCFYTHIDATSPISGDIITEHLHMQIYFTNLTFLHSSFKLQA
jgi:hypothetical protein